METKHAVLAGMGSILIATCAFAQYAPPVVLPVDGDGPENGNLAQIVGMAIDAPGDTPHPAAFFTASVTDGSVAGTHSVDISTFAEIRDVAAIPGGIGAFLIATRTPVSEMDRLAYMDGSPNGTHLIEELVDAVPEGILKFHGFVQQSIVFETHTQRLMVSDGTLAGTHTLLPGGVGTYIQKTSFGTNQGFVYAFDGQESHIWRIGPSPADTRDITPNVTPPFHSQYLTAFGYGACFVAGSQSLGNISGAGLYCTDGTVAGTLLINAASTGELFVIQDEPGLQKFGSKLYFVPVWKPSPGSPDTFQSPWVTDGSPEGTLRLPQAAIISERRIGTADGHIFYSGYPLTGLQYPLWNSDGSTSGTQELFPSVWYVVGSQYTDWFSPDFNSTAFFLARGPVTANPNPHVQRSDGTANGTFMMPTPAGVFYWDWKPSTDCLPARIGHHVILCASVSGSPMGFWSYNLDPIFPGTFD